MLATHLVTVEITFSAQVRFLIVMYFQHCLATVYLHSSDGNEETLNEVTASGSMWEYNWPTTRHLIGAWRPVDRACWLWDQKIWGSIPTAGYVQKCYSNFAFHTVSAYPVMMGTWSNEKLEKRWMALAAENVLYYSQRRWDCIREFQY